MLTAIALGILAWAPARTTVEIDVEGLKRKAIVVLPESVQPSPVIFAFHGHGGNMNNAARRFAIEKHWPEATVVYMEGIPTATPNDPQGRRNGWQLQSGANGGRDLKFFDEMLTWVRQKRKIDERRIYATGHSNGAGFTYLLWGSRPGLFAAIAPIAGGFGTLDSPRPIPVLHIAGTEDPIVRFDRQMVAVERMKLTNKTGDRAKKWSHPACDEWSSAGGPPVVLYTYKGGHEIPPDGPEVVVKFFRQHQKR